MSVRKAIVLGCMLMLVVISLGPTVTTPRDNHSGNLKPAETAVSSTVSGRILVDESHTARDTELWTPGNASRFGSMMMDYGHTIVTNFDSPLDSGILDSYDILMLFFPQVELTTAEVSAVHSFVDSGGNLVLVGIDNRPTVSNYTSQPLNAVSEVYGITFNQDSLMGRATRSDGELVDHHITYDVDSILARAGNFLQSCSLDVSSPATSIATVKGNDYLAVAEVGTAKVVAIGSASPFFVLDRDGWLVSNDDSHQLSLNIIDWLLGEPERKVEVPDEYVISIRDGPNLSQAELEEYQMFVGSIHDHTTYSDGGNTAKEMLLSAVESQLDFLVMTDHSWETPSQVGIYGGLEVKSHVTRYGLDILPVVGAELSNGPHVIGFPLTENIYSGVMEERVGGIHDQGGIAILAHPLLGQGYIEPWDKYDDYGFDAFEVINTEYFYGEGESAYYRQFVVADDAHSTSILGQTVNAIFVKNPTGPGGTLSDADIVDAILNRRVVGLVRPLSVVIGDNVWVQRYLDVRGNAQTAISDAEAVINQAINDGDSVNLARAYLAAAKDAFASQNPARAISHATAASSEFILGIDITLDDGFGTLSPNTDASLTLTLSNTLVSDVSLNVTPFFGTNIIVDQPYVRLEAQAGKSGTVEITGSVGSFGYTDLFLNLKNYSANDYIRPVILGTGGLIANVSLAVSWSTDGANIDVQLRLDRGDNSYLKSATITYDSGDGETTEDMEYIGGAYAVTLGPIAAGTNVTFTITVDDIYGNTFIIGEQNYLVEGTTILDPVLMVVTIAAVIGIVALVAVIKLRK